MTTTLPCRITAAISGNTKITCFHKLREAIKDQGWKTSGKTEKEGDIVIVEYTIYNSPRRPSGDLFEHLADIMGALPAIPSPTDGVFAEATFDFNHVYSSVTIKAPAGWLI